MGKKSKVKWCFLRLNFLADSKTQDCFSSSCIVCKLRASDHENSSETFFDVKIKWLGNELTQQYGLFSTKAHVYGPLHKFVSYFPVDIAWQHTGCRQVSDKAF